MDFSHIQAPDNKFLKIIFMIIWFIYTSLFIFVMIIPHFILKMLGKKGFLEFSYKLEIDFHFRAVPYKEAIKKE